MFDLLIEFLSDILPWLRRKRDRAREWTGTVEAKRTWGLSKHAYLVIFRTDEGRREKVRMDSKEEFDRFEDGRRYFKKAGEDLPEPRPRPA
jgi:hypothetical protein